jgi:hypothetical protein
MDTCACFSCSLSLGVWNCVYADNNTEQVLLLEASTYMNMRYHMLNCVYVCVVVKQMVQDVLSSIRTVQRVRVGVVRYAFHVCCVFCSARNMQTGRVNR